MHVGSVLDLRRARRRTTTTSSRGSSAGCTWSRATASGSRSRRSASRGRCGSTTRTSTPRYHVRHTALPGAGGRGPAAAARGARVLPAARPREAAVGDLARRRARRRPLRADLQDPPRARGRDLGRGHHDRALRPRARPAGARARRRRGRRGRCRAAPSCSRRRSPSAWPRRSASRARCSSRPDQAGAERGPRRRRAGGDGRRGDRGRAAVAAERADRAAPPLRVGRGRPRACSRRSRTRSAARSTTSC